jgi:hypothetical protein
MGAGDKIRSSKAFLLPEIAAMETWRTGWARAEEQSPRIGERLQKVFEALSP